MTRIRYSKTKQEGLLESKQVFTHPTNGGKYKVYLNLQEHKYLVVTADQDEVVAATETYIQVPKLKRKAKEALEKLGVVFSDETRKVA